MAIHDDILAPHFRITTDTVYNKTKQGKNKWLIQWNFHQTSQFHVWHLEMKKPVQHIMYHNYYYPNTFSPIQYIRFLTSWINLLDIGNIQPDHQPSKITKVSTIERNIIHNLTIDINNIIMGITSKVTNTAYPITNTNSPWWHTSKGSNFNTWWWWFTASKFYITGANGTYLSCPSHKSPPQQETNIIPDEHHTTPTIWSPMFKGGLI